MKLLVAVALVSTGCMGGPRLTGPEHCARQSMVLSGSTVSTGEVTGSSYNTQTEEWTNTTGELDGVNYQCRVPETQEDQCTVRAAGASGEVKGGLFWWYPGRRDNIREEADNVFQATYGQCIQSGPGAEQAKLPPISD